MILVVAATGMEIDPIQQFAGDGVDYLVSGVGLVETTYTLTSYLLANPEIKKVIHVGIAGGFADAGINLLDCCLAQSETIADLGISFTDRFETLDPQFLYSGNRYECKNPWHRRFSDWLIRHPKKSKQGCFLSVNSVSGTTARGAMLNSHGCICENMEGAAVARVCQGRNLDWFEFRGVSNLVEDRDVGKWRIPEAVERYTETILEFLQDVKP